jgi:hypothetical protein
VGVVLVVRLVGSVTFVEVKDITVVEQVVQRGD